MVPYCRATMVDGYPQGRDGSLAHPKQLVGRLRPVILVGRCRHRRQECIDRFRRLVGPWVPWRRRFLLRWVFLLPLEFVQESSTFLAATEFGRSALAISADNQADRQFVPVELVNPRGDRAWW